jgi:iron complex outermembrane receptor protein
VLGALLCFIASLATYGAPAPGEKVRFDIPRQPLSSALHEFSRQSRHQLLYPSEIVQKDLPRALFGYYTVEEGLAHLLQDSGLEFVMDGQGSVAVRRERRSLLPELPVPSAPSATVHSVAGQPESSDVAIAEVIVQARRRDENLQQVPVAVTALDADEIEVRNIQSTEDLNGRAPGVAVNGGNFFGRATGAFRVRGIPGVAFYVDGVVRSSAEGLLMNVVDLERMEMLRGPQGTTFGKNAIGGAVQYITQRPREETQAKFKTTLGSMSRKDLTATLDLPLAPTLFSKVAVATLNRDGYMDSTTTGASLGDQEDRVARFDLLWRPSERFDALFIAEYVEQDTNGTPATVWELNPVCPGDAVPGNFVGAVPNSLCVYRAVGAPIKDEWLYGAREQWKTAASAGAGNSYTSLGGVIQLDWRLSDRLQLKSISGYRELEAFRDHDFDGTPYALYQAFSAAKRDETSQELQLLYSDSRLSGTTGLYYYADEHWGTRQNWVANELRFEPFTSLRNALGGDFASYVPPLINSLMQNRSEGWAIFSEWTYRLTDKLSLSAGARYNNDDIAQATYPPAYVLPERCCTPTRSTRPAGPALPGQSGSATFTQLSPRFSAQYQWTPAVMTYYTYSQGFGAGGFTGGNVFFLPNGGFASYGPETLTNHEIGVRTDLFARRLRLNATVFSGDYDDIQVAEEVQQTPGFVLTRNAGEARIEGVEIEGALSPNRQLALNFSASWLDAAYTSIGNAKNLRIDSPLAYAPRFAYSVGAQYEWNLPGGAALTARADYVWQDDVYSAPDINTRTFQPAYGVANARVAFADASGHWEVSLMGTNVLNQFYRLTGFFLPADQIEIGTPARPREWSLSVRYATR